MTSPTIPKPNYTQTPNVIFDELLPTLGYAELKVLMWLCRQTFGWHEEWTGGPQRNASIRATVAGTGLSKPAVIKAYASLEARGLAEWRNAANGDVEWRIKTDAAGGKAALPASANGVVKQVDQGGKVTYPPVVKQVDPLKETETKAKEPEYPSGETAAAGAPLDAGGLDDAPVTGVTPGQPESMANAVNGTHPATNGRSGKPPRPARGGAAPLGPGAVVYRDVVHLTPNHVQRVTLDDALAAHGEARMRAVLADWLGRGYSPKNVTGMVDAMAHGLNGYARNGHGRVEIDLSGVLT